MKTRLPQPRELTPPDWDSLQYFHQSKSYPVFRQYVENFMALLAEEALDAADERSFLLIAQMRAFDDFFRRFEADIEALGKRRSS